MNITHQSWYHKTAKTYKQYKESLIEKLTWILEQHQAYCLPHWLRLTIVFLFVLNTTKSGPKSATLYYDIPQALPITDRTSRLKQLSFLWSMVDLYFFFVLRDNVVISNVNDSFNYICPKYHILRETFGLQRHINFVH